MKIDANFKILLLAYRAALPSQKRNLNQKERKLLFVCCEALITQQKNVELFYENKKLKKIINKLENPSPKKFHTCWMKIYRLMLSIFKGIGNALNIRIGSKKLENLMIYTYHTVLETLTTDPTIENNYSKLIKYVMHSSLENKRQILKNIHRFYLLSTPQAIDFPSKANKNNIQASKKFLEKYQEAKSRGVLEHFFAQPFFNSQLSIEKQMKLLMQYQVPNDDDSSSIDENREDLEENKVLKSSVPKDHKVPPHLDKHESIWEHFSKFSEEQIQQYKRIYRQSPENSAAFNHQFITKGNFKNYFKAHIVGTHYRTPPSNDLITVKAEDLNDWLAHLNQLGMFEQAPTLHHLPLNPVKKNNNEKLAALGQQGAQLLIQMFEVAKRKERENDELAWDSYLEFLDEQFKDYKKKGFDQDPLKDPQFYLNFANADNYKKSLDNYLYFVDYDESIPHSKAQGKERWVDHLKILGVFEEVQHLNLNSFIDAQGKPEDLKKPQLVVINHPHEQKNQIIAFTETLKEEMINQALWVGKNHHDRNYNFKVIEKNIDVIYQIANHPEDVRKLMNHPNPRVDDYLLREIPYFLITAYQLAKSKNELPLFFTEYFSSNGSFQGLLTSTQDYLERELENLKAALPPSIPLVNKDKTKLDNVFALLEVYKDLTARKIAHAHQIEVNLQWLETEDPQTARFKIMNQPQYQFDKYCNKQTFKKFLQTEANFIGRATSNGIFEETDLEEYTQQCVNLNLLEEGFEENSEIMGPHEEDLGLDLMFLEKID